MLPDCYPKWELVYYYFAKWQDIELFVHLNGILREDARKRSARKTQCSAVIIDSKSAKTTRRGGFSSVDGNQRINGRKRHLPVDARWNIVHVPVHPTKLLICSSGAYMKASLASRLSMAIVDTGES